MDQVRHVVDQMDRDERDLLRARAEEVDASATGARWTLLVGTLVGLLLVTGAGLVITRSLATQIGSAVQHVRSSSAELQTAANQQVGRRQGAGDGNESDHDDDQRTSRDLPPDRRERAVASLRSPVRRGRQPGAATSRW